MDVSACERWATLRCRAAQRFCRRCRVRDGGCRHLALLARNEDGEDHADQGDDERHGEGQSRRDILTAAECASPLAGRV